MNTTSETTYLLELDSPVGRLRLLATADAICGIYLPVQRAPAATPNERHPVLVAAAAQLREYFAGTRRRFDLPLQQTGTEFQRTVWRALVDIPYAATRSYAGLALAIARPRAPRAVGAANGKNPISIVVPCHRVIGQDGGLTGYAGGQAAKRWLLDHEARHARAPGLSDRS